MMDRLEWFPYSLLHICQQHDIDILLGIVPNHRAHSSVDPLFLGEQDVPALVHRELQPIAIHLPPLLADMVKHLRSKECLHGWSREQCACRLFAQLVAVADEERPTELLRVGDALEQVHRDERLARASRQRQESAILSTL